MERRPLRPCPNMALTPRLQAKPQGAGKYLYTYSNVKFSLPSLAIRNTCRSFLQARIRPAGPPLIHMFHADRRRENRVFLCGFSKTSLQCRNIDYTPVTGLIILCEFYAGNVITSHYSEVQQYRLVLPSPLLSHIKST